MSRGKDSQDRQKAEKRQPRAAEKRKTTGKLRGKGGLEMKPKEKDKCGGAAKKTVENDTTDDGKNAAQDRK